MAEAGTGLGDSEETLQRIRSQFLQGLPGRLEQIETAARALGAEGSREALEVVSHLVHRLSGAGATFGYAAVSQTALALEQLLRTASASGQFPPDLFPDLLELVRRLGEACTAATRESAAYGRGPALLPRAGRDLRALLLVEDDPAIAEQLAEQLRGQGYEVARAERPTELPEVVRTLKPACVLMDIMFAEGRLAGAEAVATMQSEIMNPPPVVFFSVRSDLEARLAAVRAGGSAYFTKPVDVPGLVERLDELSGRRPKRPYHVLVVDDDVELARFYAETLRASGMTTEVVSDPLSVLDQLAALEPDLVLLDYHLPGLSGRDLASALRQAEGYGSLPILFLSTELDRETQLRAMESGADEFLTKPIDPRHLVLAVSSRARRGRELQGLLERDGLTRLLNHASLRRNLEVEISRAHRQRKPLCFAMLDLDRFKTTNDSLGHAAGDRVLRTIANLLMDRLRKTDLIGRYGGDELGVILPDTAVEEGLRLLDSIRAQFAAMRLLAESGQEVTFSGGLASFPGYSGSVPLIEAADRALYEAKRAGRNKIASAPQPSSG